MSAVWKASSPPDEIMDTFLRWNGLQEADVQRWNAEMRAGIPGVAPEGLALHTNNGGRMKGAAMPPASASGSSRLSRVQASAMTTSSRKPFVQSPENRQIPQEKPFETAEDFQAWVDGLTTCQNGDHFSSPIRPPPHERHFGRQEEIVLNRERAQRDARPPER